MTDDTAMADSRDMVAVHDMYRREFDRLADLVATVPIDDPTRVRVVTDHGAFLIGLLHAHHGSEDALVWPKLLERGDGAAVPLTTTMTAQHAVVDRQLREVEERLATLAQAPTARSRSAVVEALGALTPPLREHLALEEGEALVLIDRHLTQAEWGEVGGAGLAEVPPEMVPVMFGMLLDGMSPQLYAVLRSAVPPEVLDPMAEAGPVAWAAYRRTLEAAATG